MFIYLFIYSLPPYGAEHTAELCSFSFKILHNLLFDLCLHTAATGDENESEQQSKSLMNFLQHFNQNRHHVTNPEGKQKARDFIKKTFQDLGLTTWSEAFTEPEFFNPQVNINIAMHLYFCTISHYNVFFFYLRSR